MKKGCELLEFYNRLRSDDKIVIEKFEFDEKNINFKISKSNDIGIKTIENTITDISEINLNAFFKNLPPEERKIVPIEIEMAERKFKSKIIALYKKYIQ